MGGGVKCKGLKGSSTNPGEIMTAKGEYGSITGSSGGAGEIEILGTGEPSKYIGGVGGTKGLNKDYKATSTRY